MAIERSTPDQVALWIKTLLDWACDDNFLDDVAWGEGDKDADGDRWIICFRGHF